MISDDVCDYCDHEGCSDGRFCPFFTEFMGKDLGQRRAGKWLHPSGDTDAPYKCSICGVKSNTPFEECPNCWSRMEKIEQYTPRVGRWEDAYCGFFVATEYTCSLCGHTVLDAGNEIDNCGYKYCPHCGRKMAND